MTRIRRYKQKSLLPKFQLIPILRLQGMHDYVHWHCSIDYCVKLSLVYEILCPKSLSFHKEMISAWFFWGNVLFRGELQIDAINSNFENFESALYMKSVNMPLSLNFKINLIFYLIKEFVIGLNICLTLFYEIEVD